tara:strand:+ start:5831 stop:7306 length:1476 start_codon:yes stop_codon:yes gene_type:complete
MAINLNPGADATLVQAAYAASMANVPKDLSPIYKQMGDSYQKAMLVFGEGFAKLGEEVGKIGVTVVKNAIENANYKARGIYMQGQYGTTFFTDQLNSIKEGMKATGYGITLDPEKRGEYLALKDQKEKLFAQIELLSNSETFSDDALINGTYSANATGKANMIFKMALQKRGEKINNSDNPEYNGYRVSVDTRDNGDLFFTLMNDKGLAVTHQDVDGNLMTDGDKNMTVDINNINDLLIQEDLSSKTALNKLFQDEISNGKKDKTKFRKNRFGNSLNNLLADEGTMRYLMYSDDLASDSLDRSFASDINNMGTFSADLYGSMAQIAVDKKMDIKDTDKVKGISAGDFATPENYAKVKDAVLNNTSKHYDAGNTKAIFKEWLTRAGSDQFLYGTTLRADPRKNNGGGGKDYGYSDPIGNIWRSDETVRGKASDLKTYKKGRSISMWDDDYEVIVPGKKYRGTDNKIYTLEQIWDNNGMPSDLLTGGGSSRIE